MPDRSSLDSRRGSILIVVLVFLALLAVLVLGFLARATLDLQISDSSANIVVSDVYGSGTIDQIIGALKQEIAAGSQVSAGGQVSPLAVYTNSAGVVSYIYRPSIAANSVPYNSGPYSPDSSYWTTFPNLVKESIHGVSFYPAANYDANGSSLLQAAPVSTTSESTRVASGSIVGSSLNGTFVPSAVWNEHLLLPKATVTLTGGTGGTPVVLTDSGGTDTTPNSAFVAPDWILTAADGSNPTTFNQAAMTNPQLGSYVVGRYAYAIYNEGGLLDANVAGSPAPPAATVYQPTGGSSSTVNQTTFLSRKGPASFADLTQLPGIANVSAPQSIVDQLVGWRNYASSQPAGNFPSYSLASSVNNYFSFLQGLSTQSMQNGATNLFQGQSDRFFTSRSQLISFLKGLSATPQTQAYLQDAMMYLGTFSRSLNRPSYWPDPSPGRPLVSGLGYSECGVNNLPPGNNAYQKDGPFIAGTSSAGSFNPPFGNIRVTKSFVRNDGTMAALGDQLVSKRFALNRLAWITYKGPISTLNSGDPLFAQYQNLGIPPSMIIQWMSEGNPTNIKKYFGLTWTAGPAGNLQPGGYWVYDPDGDEGTSAMMIKTLDQVAAKGRDPTFFELLKASITAGSLAKAGLPLITEMNPPNPFPPTLNFLLYRDTRVDYHILQIGANILNQVSPANYPMQIVAYDNGSAIKANQSFTGVTDVPYLYETANVFIETTQPNPVPSSAAVTPALALTNPGKVVALEIPIIWNPHSPGPSPYMAGLTPTKFRIGVSDAVWPSISSVSPPQGEYRLFPTYNWSAVSMPGPFSTVSPQWGNQNGYPKGPFPTSGTWSTSSTATGYGTSIPLASINPVSATDSYATATGRIDFTPVSGAGAYDTEIYFDGDSTGNTTLYREPTPLMYSTGNGTSAGGFGVYLDSNNILNAVGGFSTPYITDALNTSSNQPNYLGFFEGEFPLCWNAPTSPPPTPPAPATTTTYSVNTVTFSNLNGMGSTYSLEYQVGGVWIPYEQNNLYGEEDQKFGGSGVAITAIPTNVGGTISPYGTVTWDPRTVRWGGSQSVDLGSFLTGVTTGPTWSVTMQTVRPNAAIGYVDSTHVYSEGGVSKDQYLSKVWTPVTNSKAYVVDPDLVVRRPMGAYTPLITNPTASTTIGLPLATVYPTSTSTTTGNGSNRPIILHRPFRSVAELGYVFSDTPWRNLDFFTPESGCGALLDVFCINEDNEPNALGAGRVDLNTKQAPVIQALLAGAYRDETDPNNANIQNLSTSEAAAIAQDLVKRTSGNGTVVGGTAATGPLSNIADLVGRYTPGAVATPNNTPGAGVPYDGFSADLSLYTGGSGSASASSVYNIVQRFRESTMRALSDAGQAGTWNLLIDVVAQTGRYPITATNLAQFAVKGQRHYWVHVAIDRSTGQVIDENIEVVPE